MSSTTVRSGTGSTGKDLLSEVAFLARELKTPVINETFSMLGATGPGRAWTHDRMCSCDGVSFVWISSPVTPSIAAAATDRACTSSPTLVRSINTGASHNCRIGRAGGPCSVAHEHV